MTSFRSTLRILGAIQDRVSKAGFVLGTALCGYIAVSLCYEVVARYFFSAPTQWSNAFSNYALAIAIFSALPEMTRRGAHISVNILLIRAPEPVARLAEKLILAISGAVTLFAAWICAADTWRQYQENIVTISSIAVPKWGISIFIALGLAGAGIYFLRALARPFQRPSDSAPA